MVIIGILMGAILKGQQLIYNAKVKRTESQIKEMQAAFYTYYDTYGYYPGDDPNAQNRWANATNGNGNGLVEGGYCNSAGEESCLLWQDLRYANIITGDPADATPTTMVPHHAFGGPIDMFTGTYTIGGQSRTGLWITLRNVDVKAAEAIDRALDDGKCKTGSIARYGGVTCKGDGSYRTSGYIDIWMNF